MSGFAKLTVKALRALAEEYEVQLPAGRITKGKLIEILEAENIQPPWGGPEWKCPTPASLMKAGLLLGVAPPADLAGSSSSLAGLQGGKRLWLGRRLSPGSPEKEAVALSESPNHSGRSGDLGRIAGGREGRGGRGRKGRLAPFSPLEERGSLASAGEPFFFRAWGLWGRSKLAKLRN